MSVEEINKKLDELLKYAEGEFNRIINELESIIEEVKEKGDNALINTSVLRINRDVRNFIRNLRMQLRTIKRTSKALSRDTKEFIIERIEDVEDDIGDMIDELFDKLDEVRDSIRSVRVESSLLTPPLSDIFRVTTTTLSNLSKALSEAFSEIRSEVEKGVVKGVSTVVSVRVSEEDLKVVDLLVNVGVFKSRSEALSFFIRRGIKVSEELIKKIRERIEELSKLVNELEDEAGKS